MNPSYHSAMSKRREHFYRLCEAVVMLDVNSVEEFEKVTEQDVLDYMHGLALIDNKFGWSVP